MTKRTFTLLALPVVLFLSVLFVVRVHLASRPTAPVWQECKYITDSGLPSWLDGPAFCAGRILVKTDPETATQIIRRYDAHVIFVGDHGRIYRLGVDVDDADELRRIVDEVNTFPNTNAIREIKGTSL